MNAFLIVSLGAILGANARYILEPLYREDLRAGFPYGTLFINVSGSLVVGSL